MTEHYYSNRPEVESDPKFWDYALRGRSFRFKSDNGVFSKSEVDFGSRLLIDTFTLNENVEGKILDVGCGYGPIGISIAASYPTRMVDMIDINSRAIGLSKDNASLNVVSNVSIYESDLFEKVDTTPQYAAILTNPPIRAGKKVVHEIFEGSYHRLVEGGSLWVVIQKKQGAPSAMDKLEQLFGNVEIAEKKKGYFILISKKV